MGAVHVLVGHNHHLAVAQVLDDVILRRVPLALFQSQNLFEIHNLGVGVDLVGAFDGRHLLTRVNHLATQRKHAVVIATDHRQTRHSHSLGRVSLGENQRALVCVVLLARVVGIVQLVHVHTPTLAAFVFFRFGHLLVPVQFEHLFHQSQFFHFCQERWRQHTRAAKLAHRRAQRVFRLAVKRRVFNRSPHKQHQIVLDVRGTHFDLLLLFNNTHDVVGNLVRNVVRVLATLHCPHAVHKRLLLVAIVRDRHTHFPAGVDNF